MRKFKTSGFISAVAASSLLAISARGEDWPQWGGNDPGRNMYSSAKNLPERIVTDADGKINFKAGGSELDLKNAPNVKWAAKLGSQSFGNVVVAKGKILVGTNNENPRD